VPDDSEWTLSTLKEYLEGVLTAHDRRYEQRFEDQKQAVNTAMAAAEKAVQAALSAADQAVRKAETASERRFDSVNEFRLTLSDQQRTLWPRAEGEKLLEVVNERLTLISARLDRLEGQGMGKGAGWAAAAAVVALVAMAMTLLKGWGKP
jgi:hypothetical protein